MTWQVEMEPCAPKAPTLPAIEIRHSDRDQSAAAKGARDGFEVAPDVVGVLERMLEDRCVVGARLELDGGKCPFPRIDASARRRRARPGGGLDTDGVPAALYKRRGEISASAADVNDPARPEVDDRGQRVRECAPGSGG